MKRVVTISATLGEVCSRGGVFTGRTHDGTEAGARAKSIPAREWQGCQDFRLVADLFKRLHSAGTLRDRAGRRELSFDRSAGYHWQVGRHRLLVSQSDGDETARGLTGLLN